MIDPRRPPMLDRRSLLKGAVAAGLLVPGWPLSRATPARADLDKTPFTLGVASGDPAPDGFVIWTRLAPEPFAPRGGLSMQPVEVTWEIGDDASMRQVVRTGVAMARIELAHSVHVELEGLEPARDYFYRFRTGNAVSPVGRARTLPAPGADLTQVRFAAAGCQAFESGYYTAWRHLAAENFDFVFHYGDYIYEHGFVTVDRAGRTLPRQMPRDFSPCVTLTDYRQRYALYKSDPDLQAAHLSCPFLPSFDDHEVADNWAADTDSRDTPADAFLFRRAAAFQAWYEHMPVRRALLPRGPDVLAYRRFRIGSLMDVAVLDTRQYRSRQPCGDGIKADCTAAEEPSRTMLGARQEAWFAEGLRAANAAGPATWQVLAQQVLFAHLDWRSYPWLKPSDAPLVNLDAWDGASAARDRLLRTLHEAKVANAVVLTGDMHRGVALDLPLDWRDPASPCVGVELLATSISSGGDGVAVMSNADALHANNPHLKFISDQRGYHRHTVTRGRWQADFRVVAQISQPDHPIATVKSFVVEAGKPGLVEA